MLGLTRAFGGLHDLVGVGGLRVCSTSGIWGPAKKRRII
jgi:hypothetical protein